MKSKPQLLFLMILGLSVITIAFNIRLAKATWVEGHITQDTTWSSQDSPFIVINDVTVDPNATLTIESGVEVRFGGNFLLNIQGSLRVIGNAADVVLFTSNRPNPIVGDWKGINFAGGSNQTFVMDYAVISFAVHGIETKSYYASMGPSVISHTTLSQNQVGLYYYGAFHNGTIDSCEIHDNLDDGILLHSTYSSPAMENITIKHNNIYSNHGNGIWIRAESTGSAIVRNVSILENRIFSNSKDGIRIDSIGRGTTGNAQVYNITVAQNHISDSMNALTLYDEIDWVIYQGVADAKIYDFLVQNNTFSSCINGTNIVAWYQPGGTHYTMITADLLNNSISYNNLGVFGQRMGASQRIVDVAAHFNDIYQNTFGADTSLAFIDATYSYWGDSSGPYHPTLNPYGTGNPAGGDGTYLLFIPYLTNPVGHINQRPLARLVVNNTDPRLDETVSFDGSNSSDDGRVDYYFFDFGDGTDSGWTPLSVFTHEYTKEGEYNATLIVMDDFGVRSNNTASQTITVSTHVNEAPIAVLTVDKANPDMNETVTFNASASHDPDGQVVSYFFDFGDGSNSSWISSSTYVHQYSSQTTCYATVTVKDNSGATSTNSQAIRILITVIPEFPSLLVLEPFMMATVLAVTICKKKRETS